MTSIILSMFLTAAMAGNDDSLLTLRARFGDQTAWKVSLVSDSKCQISVKDRVTILSYADCENLKQVYPKVKAFKWTAYKHQAQTPDEPLYSFMFDGQEHDVELIFAQECELLRGGQLKCAERQLTPPQELLLILRKYANKR